MTDTTDPAIRSEFISPERRLVFDLAEVFYREADYAASISHRPEHVRHIFLDANSRCWMAEAVLNSPEMQAIRRVLSNERESWSCWECGGHDDVVAQLPANVAEWVATYGDREVPS